MASRLTILQDGTVQHTERQTADEDVIAEPPLTSEDLAALKAQIAAAAAGPFSEREGQPSSFGSQSGTFEACNAGNGFVVRNILRSSDPQEGSLDDVIVNEAASAATVLSFALEYTEVDMYEP